MQPQHNIPQSFHAYLHVNLHITAIQLSCYDLMNAHIQEDRTITKMSRPTTTSNVEDLLPTALDSVPAILRNSCLTKQSSSVNPFCERPHDYPMQKLRFNDRCSTSSTSEPERHSTTKECDVPKTSYGAVKFMATTIRIYFCIVSHWLRDWGGPRLLPVDAIPTTWP